MRLLRGRLNDGEEAGWIWKGLHCEWANKQNFLRQGQNSPDAPLKQKVVPAGPTGGEASQALLRFPDEPERRPAREGSG